MEYFKPNKINTAKNMACKHENDKCICLTCKSTMIETGHNGKNAESPDFQLIKECPICHRKCECTYENQKSKNLPQKEKLMQIEVIEHDQWVGIQISCTDGSQTVIDTASQSNSKSATTQNSNNSNADKRSSVAGFQKIPKNPLKVTVYRGFLIFEDADGLFTAYYADGRKLPLDDASNLESIMGIIISIIVGKNNNNMVQNDNEESLPTP